MRREENFLPKEHETSVKDALTLEGVFFIVFLLYFLTSLSVVPLKCWCYYEEQSILGTRKKTQVKVEMMKKKVLV